MTIKSFRGSLADGAQEEINLRTNDGKTGYRIVKFQLMHNEPGQHSAEHTVKIYSEKQTTTIDNAIDFSDHSLLAAGYILDNPDNAYPVGNVIIFDNVTFNQNIFVTHEDTVGSRLVNYYLELEQIKLNDNESTMATLQSIRSRYESYTPAGPT